MLIAANWKMNCLVTEAELLINMIKKNYSGENELIIFPPITLLEKMAIWLEGSTINCGAQNCHTEQKGAFTGEISAEMIADFGARYTLVGHSERRQYCSETNELVKNKAIAAIRAGLIPIICIGETLQQREAGKTENIITEQINSCIPKGFSGKFIIAYEPVWAIGTGLTPTNMEIAGVHALIASHLPGISILYGGSVNEKNCTDICSIDNVSGVLVGVLA